jgi:hypothetical protein
VKGATPDKRAIINSPKSGGMVRFEQEMWNSQK